MKRLAVILLAGIATMAAADAPIVNVIGVTEFEVPAVDPFKTVDVLPPITLVIANDMGPETNGAASMRVKLTSVSVGTAAHSEYGRAFEFGSFAAGKKGELREVPVKVHLSEIPEPQTYLVKVLIFRDGDPSVAPQALDLKFTRPAATLSVSPLRLESVRYFPVFGVFSLSPDKLKLQETSRRATLTEIQIQVKDYLKGPDDFPTASQIEVPMIDRIDAGKESTKKLAFAGNLPLGSTKGSLIVRSRQLAQPFDVPIEIVTRVSRLWLIAAISISIWMGYRFRTILDKRKTENQSRLTAEQQFGLIDDLKKKAVDSDVIRKLKDILLTLKNAIDAEPFVATQLDAAVKKAIEDADTEMKSSETARAALRTRLKEFRVTLDSPHGQPGVLARTVTKWIGRLDEQDRELKNGAVTSVQIQLEDIARELNNDVQNGILTWAQQLHGALAEMGSWQGLEFESMRKKLFDETDPTKARELDLRKTRDVAREVLIYVLGAGLHQAIDCGAQVLARLERLKLGNSNQELDTCRNSLDAARKLKDVGIDQAAEVAETLHHLRSALINAIRGAATIKSVPSPEGLDEGDFGKAMAKLSASLPQPEAALGGHGGQPPAQAIAPLEAATSVSMLLSVATAAQSEADSWWDLQLSVPVSPEAGEQAVASVAVIGRTPGAVDIEWTIGNSIVHSGPGAQAFTPDQTGALAISARGVARTTGEARTASAVIQVRAMHGLAAARRLADQLERDDKLQSFVAGIFIAVVGYAIFQGNWYGTFMDFMAAVLWGFTVDVSIAKVREIASPVLGRPVPLPSAK